VVRPHTVSLGIAADDAVCSVTPCVGRKLFLASFYAVWILAGAEECTLPVKCVMRSGFEYLVRRF